MTIQNPASATNKDHIGPNSVYQIAGEIARQMDVLVDDRTVRQESVWCFGYMPSYQLLSLLLNVSTAWAELPRLRPDNFFDFASPNRLVELAPKNNSAGKLEVSGRRGSSNGGQNPVAAMAELEPTPTI